MCLLSDKSVCIVWLGSEAVIYFYFYGFFFLILMVVNSYFVFILVSYVLEKKFSEVFQFFQTVYLDLSEFDRCYVCNVNCEFNILSSFFMKKIQKRKEKKKEDE